MSPTNDRPQPPQFRAVSSQRDYTTSPTNDKPDMNVVMSNTEEPSFALCDSSACLVQSYFYPLSEMDESSSIPLSVVKRLNLPTFGTENSENDKSKEMGADSVTYHTMSSTNDRPCNAIEMQMSGRGIGGTDVGSWMKNNPPSPVIFGFVVAWMLTRRARMRDRTKPSSQVQNPADSYGSSLQAVKGSLCQAP